MQTYRNETLQHRSLILEDSGFVNCTLKNCDLYYSGGDFDWADCRFENCRFHWRGPAKNTVGLLQMMGALPQAQPLPPGMVPPATAGQKPN